MRQRPTAQPIATTADDVEQADHRQRPAAHCGRQAAGRDPRPAGGWPGRRRESRRRRSRRRASGSWGCATRVRMASRVPTTFCPRRAPRLQRIALSRTGRRQAQQHHQRPDLHGAGPADADHQRRRDRRHQRTGRTSRPRSRCRWPGRACSAGDQPRGRRHQHRRTRPCPRRRPPARRSRGSGRRSWSCTA